MQKVGNKIRMTESEFHSLIRKCVKEELSKRGIIKMDKELGDTQKVMGDEMIKEDGEAGMMGDAGGFDMNNAQGSTTTFSTGNYTYDANALNNKLLKRDIGTSKDGDITKQKTNIDSADALSRPKGGICVNQKR